AVRAHTAEVEARPGMSTTSGPWPFVSTRMREDWNSAGAGAAVGRAAWAAETLCADALDGMIVRTAERRAKQSDWRMASACPWITAKPRPGRARGGTIVFSP